MTNPSRLPIAFADTLASVQRPGGFHVAGTFDIHPPRLVVDGVGTIALPLLPVQAEALIGVAEAAPYGRGTETLHDPAVRRTWQIDAARVSLGGAHWLADLAAVVARVRAGLGVAGEVGAELYKLLIYDAGAFFAPHRDTEKAPGMFGTLVVVLPGEFSGGALVIRHRGESAEVDLRCDEPATATFAAFYADCVHEVRPVTGGHRLALIFNLLRRGPGPLPVAPDYREPLGLLKRLLADWGGRPASDGDPAPGPNKLVYPLEHAYTSAELAFATLKGQDAAVAGLLQAAAPAADCLLYVALLSVSEYGSAEYGGDWREPEFEIGEIIDTEQVLDHWRRPDGSVPDLAPLPFTDDELAPPEALDDLDDTEPDFSEATGNEGASFERLYQRAALVLWPRRRQPAVLAAAGAAVGLPALAALVAQWERAGRTTDDHHRDEALALADALAAGWPTAPWACREASGRGDTGVLCAAWLALDARDRCAAFVAEAIADGGYTCADEDVTVQLLSGLPAPEAARLLTAVISGNVRTQPGACAALLARIGAHAGISASLAPAAAALLGGLPGMTLEVAADWRDRPEPLTPAHGASVLAALAGIDEALAQQAVDHFLANPGAYGPDTLLIPALLSMEAAPGSAAIARLRAALVTHLDRRIAEPLAPPADWTRAADLTCRCADCRAVNAFLASATAPVWQLRAVEDTRVHVSDNIRRAGSDLDLSTDKRGRPYTLVCAKNQASYERRAAQRRRDLDLRAALLASAGG